MRTAAIRPNGGGTLSVWFAPRRVSLTTSVSENALPSRRSLTGHPLKFATSLWVKGGSVSPCPISTVDEAIAFMACWPLRDRSTFFYLSNIALHSAKVGRSAPHIGYAAFHDFCLAGGIIVDAPAGRELAAAGAVDRTPRKEHPSDRTPPVPKRSRPAPVSVTIHAPY